MNNKFKKESKLRFKHHKKSRQEIEESHNIQMEDSVLRVSCIIWSRQTDIDLNPEEVIVSMKLQLYNCR